MKYEEVIKTLKDLKKKMNLTSLNKHIDDYISDVESYVDCYENKYDIYRDLYIYIYEVIKNP